MRNFSVETEGVVTEALPNAMFRIQLENETQISADLSRKMQKNYIPIAIGDHVKVVLPSCDSTRGCIASGVARLQQK